jgi:hypothetical protein
MLLSQNSEMRGELISDVLGRVDAAEDRVVAEDDRADLESAVRLDRGDPPQVLAG